LIQKEQNRINDHVLSDQKSLFSRPHLGEDYVVQSVRNERRVSVLDLDNVCSFHMRICRSSRLDPINTFSRSRTHGDRQTLMAIKHS
jgi:hypothetical protein